MIPRRTGYLPDPDGHRRTPFAHLSRRLRSQALPAMASLVGSTPPVMDQGPTGSCTGHATSAGVYTALAAAGTPLLWVPSPKGIYTVGRALDRADPNEKLEDVGAEPNQVIRGISEYGVRRMRGPTSDGRISDCEPSTIDEQPMLEEFEEDATEIFVGEYGITSTGAQREEDIKVAIAVAKVPVAVAIAGGSAAFQGYAGGVLGALNAPLDHYILAVGYEFDAHGKLVLIHLNSWSEDWGDHGFVRNNSAGIAELGDCIAMKVTRKAAA